MERKKKPSKTMPHQKLAAIIVAAGSSRRMGFDKLLAPLAGKPVLQWSIEAFLHCDVVSHVIVVCPHDRFKLLNLPSHGKPIYRTDGGKDRHDSVAAGLSLLHPDTQYVAVHDGARPLITSAQIIRVFKSAIQSHSAASARRVTETVKRATPDGIVTAPVDRDNLWLMETPQTFRADLLKKAYHTVRESGKRVTDEVSAMELIGETTQLVSNPTPNPKITYPEDLSQALPFLPSNDKSNIHHG